MIFTAWAMLAVLGVYFWTGAMAGYARVKHKVAAPSMDGPIAFQSAQRVQANTLEQLPIVIVPLWLCATYLGDGWAAAGGLLALPFVVNQFTETISGSEQNTGKIEQWN